MENFFQHWDDMNRAHERERREFEKLLLDQCADIPKVGDKVVVACGLLGMGFPWIREEAVVAEVGSSSYKVRFPGRIDFTTQQPSTKWIHAALVTDVLAAQGQPGDDIARAIEEEGDVR